MNEKLARIKKKVKENAPAIGFAALAAVTTAYTIYLKNQPRNADFLEGEVSTVCLTDEDVKNMTEEDVHPYYNLHGHRIQVHYHPIED
jgi:hypothetical protein